MPTLRAPVPRSSSTPRGPAAAPLGRQTRGRRSSAGVGGAAWGLLLALGAALFGVPAAAAPAEPYVGVDLVPLGRADLLWVDEGRASGTLAAETDGALRPPLRAWGGAVWGRNGVLLQVSTFRQTTTTWSANPEDGPDLRTRVRQGGLRVGAEHRFWITQRAPKKPVGWVGAGLYGVIPTVSYTSDAWEEGEQSGWEEAARSDRARIAGAGGSLSGGAEVILDSGLVIGARTGLLLHRGQIVTDDAISVSVLLQTEAALSLGFAF
jgi:hypothetical protein